jgi:membrane protease YdiL (CAAX protease family)
MMNHLTLLRVLVVASLAILTLAAMVTPLPGQPTWGNTLTAIGSLGYLVSLILILMGSTKARWVFLPSIVISLVGMPFAAYPAGELNALYDLTMYGSGFLNGAIAMLLHIPDS